MALSLLRGKFPFLKIVTKKGEDLEDIFNAFIIWSHTLLEKCYKRSTGDEVDNTYVSKRTGKLVSEIEVAPIDNE
ncbi:hypothetical protein BEP19_08635 [Ammoniphilus oxalaticus]|uniref:Uncharacterized protein n=1 Tax=Ammoniphilus oxalaticus TaxID=66863 RepID=A0A419SKA0_9BACL|nr:hypothetical protein BEP19_08635 [Ammoniphilus oxalaticus]